MNIKIILQEFLEKMFGMINSFILAKQFLKV
ncbi:MAG: hypothetical protein KatS3mg034_1141 [Vicingaceae bacterium]|jgi:hypothetical protein|nr:MAG: hypothetical protein KatS3mg034_1141 [Vicingaceae bacterium]